MDLHDLARFLENEQKVQGKEKKNVQNEPVSSFWRSFDLAVECDFNPDDTNYFHRKITNRKHSKESLNGAKVS